MAPHSSTPAWKIPWKEEPGGLQAMGSQNVLSHFSCVQHFVTLWTVACQAPLSMGFSRQEYWRGLPFPSPEDLPDPGIKPGSPALQADSLLFELEGSPNIKLVTILKWESGKN